MYCSLNNLVYFSHTNGLEEAGRKAVAQEPSFFPTDGPAIPWVDPKPIYQNTCTLRPVRSGRREQAVSFKVVTENVAHTLLSSVGSCGVKLFSSPSFYLGCCLFRP